MLAESCFEAFVESRCASFLFVGGLAFRLPRQVWRNASKEDGE